MPLRDHFRPPLAPKRSWQGVYGGWPMKIAEQLNLKLPEGSVAGPLVDLGSEVEVSVGTFDRGNLGSAWIPPEPTYSVNIDASVRPEYAVRVYDPETSTCLVAAVELVSPGNKHRPECRRSFVTKCAAMIEEDVCVSIIDLVTTQSPNLYAELLEHFGIVDTYLYSNNISTYAASVRYVREGTGSRLETWAYPLAVGQPLPTLPLWVAEDLAVPLELEASYEETCRALRIG